MSPSITNLDGGISIEDVPSGWNVHIARLHDPDKFYGSEWCASMVLLTRGDECIVSGGISDRNKIKSRHSRTVMSFLRSRGIRKVFYRKVKDGVLHDFEISI